MSLRQKLMIALAATMLTAACSAPTAPKGCDVPTIGGSRCVTR
jgi:hypothetical protein